MSHFTRLFTCSIFKTDSSNGLIVLDDHQEGWEELFQQIDFVGFTSSNSYALENHRSVYICHGFKHGTLADVWPALKKWDSR